jgi:hypothetical protein
MINNYKMYPLLFERMPEREERYAACAANLGSDNMVTRRAQVAFVNLAFYLSAYSEDEPHNKDRRLLYKNDFAPSLHDGFASLLAYYFEHRPSNLTTPQPPRAPSPVVDIEGDETEELHNDVPVVATPHYDQEEIPLEIALLVDHPNSNIAYTPKCGPIDDEDNEDMTE